MFIVGAVWYVQAAEPEPAVAAAKVAAARQAKLEAIAGEAIVGKNTAFIPLIFQGYWVSGTSDSFYIYQSDIVPIVDIFCEMHDVRVIGAPQPVGGTHVTGYTIYFEKVR